MVVKGYLARATIRPASRHDQLRRLPSPGFAHAKKAVSVISVGQSFTKRLVLTRGFVISCSAGRNRQTRVAPEQPSTADPSSPGTTELVGITEPRARGASADSVYHRGLPAAAGAVLGEQSMGRVGQWLPRRP